MSTITPSDKSSILNKKQHFWVVLFLHGVPFSTSRSLGVNVVSIRIPFVSIEVPRQTQKSIFTVRVPFLPWFPKVSPFSKGFGGPLMAKIGPQCWKMGPWWWEGHADAETQLENAVSRKTSEFWFCHLETLVLKKKVCGGFVYADRAQREQKQDLDDDRGFGSSPKPCPDCKNTKAALLHYTFVISGEKSRVELISFHFLFQHGWFILDCMSVCRCMLSTRRRHLCLVQFWTLAVSAFNWGSDPRKRHVWQIQRAKSTHSKEKMCWPEREITPRMS